MKKLIILFVTLLLAALQQGFAAPADDFVITVNTNNLGDSGNTKFWIPTIGSGYNYNIDCNNDGILEATAQTTDYICDFAPLGGAGNYTIRIKDNSGDGTGFHRIYFNNDHDRLKITSIVQWGSGKWSSMSKAFFGAENMAITATDIPDLSSVSNMSQMFHNAKSAKPITTLWDVSNVTRMSNMFNGATVANPDTSLWDTSNVTNMRVMFQNAVQANPDTSGWDTSKVTLMDFMFAGASAADPDVLNWDVTAVTDMSSMFLGVTLSNAKYDTLLIVFDQQNLKSGVNFHAGNSSYCSLAAKTARENMIANNWTITDGGTNSSICPPLGDFNDFVITVKTNNPGGSPPTQFIIPVVNSVFYNYNYNVDCNNDGALEASAVTGNYTCMYNPFGGVGTYTIRIIDNTGLGTGFPSITFNNGGDRLKILSIEQWGTGIWTFMSGAFEGAENLVINATDVPNFSRVTEMIAMFKGAFLVNPNTKYWNTSSSTNMNQMFSGAFTANPDTSRWNTANVTNMNSMFKDALSAKPDTKNWDTGKVFTMQDMFYNAEKANPDTSAWDVSSLNLMQGMFHQASLATPDTTNWDTSLVSNMQDAFRSASKANPNTSFWDTSLVVTMQGMFYGATLANPDTSNWNTSAVNNMSQMFANAISAAPDTGNWDTSLVTNMSSMFSNAAMANPNTNLWDTSLVTNMGGMFRNAAMANPDTSLWDTSLVTIMFFMFENAASAQPDTSNWVTNSVISMQSMFSGASLANPDTSGWNTSLVTNMRSMFENATSANPNTSSWDVSSVTVMNDMFLGVTLPSADYDSLLIGFNSQNLQSGVVFHGGNSQYCSASGQNARDNMINTDGWQITDGGLCPMPNVAPSFDLLCDIDATDVTGGNAVTVQVPNFAYNISVGPENESFQTYTLSISAQANGDPNAIISAMFITNNGELNLDINTNNSGVADLQITMVDSGGTSLGGIDTTTVTFKVHHYADLTLDPNYSNLNAGDILYKNTFEACRVTL